jgi:hypothetical protein
MPRIPLHSLETAPDVTRPQLQLAAKQTPTGDLLNLHGQMAHAPAVLASYTAIRKALDGWSYEQIRAILAGRWHFDYLDDSTAEFETEQLSTTDALLMGRRTYEAFAAVWPSRSDDFADKINSMNKYVASTTLERPTGPTRRHQRRPRPRGHQAATARRTADSRQPAPPT